MSCPGSLQERSFGGMNPAIFLPTFRFTMSPVTPTRTTRARILVCLMALFLCRPCAVALEISWPLTQIITAETPEGAVVDAIQSEPSGYPLFLGRPAEHAGMGGFQPLLQDGALVFGPNTTSYVADFWKNFQEFSFEVELKFDSVEIFRG